MLGSCLDVDDPPAVLDLWGTQVANIGDPGLKTRGEEQITSTWKEYEGIVSGLRQAATALDPFLKGLTNQINLLGSDLRPEALASLKNDAEKLNANATTVFGHVDKAVTASNTFFAPLRSK